MPQRQPQRASLLILEVLDGDSIYGPLGDYARGLPDYYAPRRRPRRTADAEEGVR